MGFIQGKLPMRLKLVHGSGAVAFGVKDTGFSFFLLIFYNQVLGMNAGTVSAALAIALLVDAIVDPLIGNLSDRTYTRWGRRLPWLYLAPIPLAFAWIMLWSPPGGEAPSFLGLLGIAIGVRVLLSACEVPSVSLVPEITSDYDERTTLFRYRYLSGWTGGIVMMLLAYTIFMPGQDGMLQAEGYATFGIFGALLMVLSVVGSAAGQHHIAAHLPAHRPGPFSLRAAFSEIRDAFSEKAFLIFAAGGLAAYIGQGMTFSMTNYVNLFVWQFEGAALTAFPVVLFVSVVMMFFLVGPMHRSLGKPRSAAYSAIGALVFALAPFILFVSGVWPQPGALASTLLVYAFLLISNTLGIVVMISASSMVAEIVEAYEERGGRRAEGAFYSGNWLVQKCATGAGIFLTGQIIAISQLPSNSAPGNVPKPVLDEMLFWYAGTATVLACIAAFWLIRFPIDRVDHERRLAILGEAARADPDAHAIAP